MNAENASSSLRTTIEFIFDAQNQLFLGIELSWRGEAVDLSLATFLNYLFKNEGEFSPKDADFCYALAKVVKRVAVDAQSRFAIPKDNDMAFFFRKSLELDVPLYWKSAQKAPTLVQRDGPLPLTVKVTRSGQQLVATVENAEAWKTNRLGWLVFHDKDSTFCFCNGTLLQNVGAKMEEFVGGFLDKPRQTFSGDNIEAFVKDVYAANKRALFWRIQADFSELLPQEIRPTPILKLKYENGTLSPALFFQYGSEIIEPTAKGHLVTESTSGKRYQRQAATEAEFQQALMSTYTEKNIPFLLQGPADIAAFQKEISPALLASGWLIDAPEIPDVTILQGETNFSFTLQSSGSDWFYFEPNCVVDDQKLSLQEIARLLVQNQGYVKTKKGYLKVSDSSRKQLNMLGQFGAFRSDHKFKKNEVLCLIHAARVEGGNAQTRKLIQEVKNFTQISEKQLEGEFKGTLRPYQVNGVQWMYFLYRHGLGGVLADDMGLGKTVQTLAFSTQLKGEGPVLIICPTNVIYNWEQEIKKFLPGKSCLVFSGADRAKHLDKLGKKDYIVTSFGITKRDLDELQAMSFKAIFVDEAQYIKNPKSQVSLAVKSLDAPFKLALTGTPVENHMQDIWNLFDFVMPGYLGTHGHFEVLLDKELDKLKVRIAPFVLRRLKQDVLESLPEKTEILLKCPLSDEQYRVYSTILEAAKKGIKTATGQRDRLNILAALLRLRQVCILPSLLDEFKAVNITAAKFDLALEKIEEVVDEGHKMVVFTQFTGVLDKLEAWAKGLGTYYERIDGAVSAKARQAAIERFQSNEKPGFFMVSLKAGGVGINLTAADYVLHLDPWWNPAVEAQATDRVHRMGQQNKVIVYKMIAQGTIEEKIQELQDKKKALLSAIVDTDSLDEKKIDFKEIQSLLMD